MPPVTHLNQVELSRRWKLSPRTLERWRWQGVGPCYLKLRGRVAYRLEDIEAFEAAQLRSGCATSALAPAAKSAPIAATPSGASPTNAYRRAA
jgi:hypothetical protein